MFLAIVCSRIHRSCHQICSKLSRQLRVTSLLFISRIQMHNPFPDIDFFCFPSSGVFSFILLFESKFNKLKLIPFFYRKTFDSNAGYFSTVADHVHLTSFAMYTTFIMLYFDNILYQVSLFLSLSLCVRTLRLKEVT